MKFKLVLVTLTTLFWGCDFTGNDNDSDCLVGDGKNITKALDVNTFNKVSSSGSLKLKILKGQTQSVKAIGDSNIIAMINTDVDSGLWKISLDTNCIKDMELTIEVTSPDLQEIGTSGSGTLEIVSVNSSTNALLLNGNGSGKIIIETMDSSIQSLTINASGSGGAIANQDISIDKTTISLNGSGNLQLFKISSDVTGITKSGSGNIEVTANKELRVEGSGSGDVKYKGTPNITQDMTGSGELVNAN